MIPVVYRGMCESIPLHLFYGFEDTDGVRLAESPSVNTRPVLPIALLGAASDAQIYDLKT